MFRNPFSLLKLLPGVEKTIFNEAKFIREGSSKGGREELWFSFFCEQCGTMKKSRVYSFWSQ